jgi:hypothetical protein
VRDKSTTKSKVKGKTNKYPVWLRVEAGGNLRPPVGRLLCRIGGGLCGAVDHLDY